MKLSRLPARVFLVLWVFILFAFPARASAGEKLFLTGAEGGTGDTTNYYTYAGLIAPVFSDHLGDGLVQRYWADFYGYSYDALQEIDAQAVGLEGALGYQKSGKAGWAAVYAGLRYNNTWLSPDDPFNRNQGEQWWVKAQVEGQVNLAERWKLGGIANYLFKAEAFWLRTRLMRGLDGGLSTGPELIHMGDPFYRAWQFGWAVTGFKPWDKAELGFKVGARVTEGAGVNALIGIELSKLF